MRRNGAARPEHMGGGAQQLGYYGVHHTPFKYSRNGGLRLQQSLLLLSTKRTISHRETPWKRAKRQEGRRAGEEGRR